MTKLKKAIVLLSGGLDSTLALRLMQDQGIDLLAVKYSSPFCTCDQKGRCFALEVARNAGVPFKMLPKGMEYLKVIRNPRYGRGKGMNPCIDCRIFMLQKVKTLMKETGADFVVTGEVLGQRPMSQHRKAMDIIERESGLQGLILRPAQFLAVTEVERRGWIDREKLLSIRGRSRKPQLKMAGDFNMDTYACAAGGCMLTQKQFAMKVRDLLEHKTNVTLNDILLLKTGRHFRFGRNKIIVGRNEEENDLLAARKQKTDLMFEVPGCGSPTTLLQGRKSEEAIVFAARLTAFYSDHQGTAVPVTYGRSTMNRTLVVGPLSRSESEIYNITLKRR